MADGKKSPKPYSRPSRGRWNNNRTNPYQRERQIYTKTPEEFAGCLEFLKRLRGREKLEETRQTAAIIGQAVAQATRNMFGAIHQTNPLAPGLPAQVPSVQPDSAEAIMQTLLPTLAPPVQQNAQVQVPSVVGLQPPVQPYQGGYGTVIQQTPPPQWYLAPPTPTPALQPTRSTSEPSDEHLHAQKRKETSGNFLFKKYGDQQIASNKSDPNKDRFCSNKTQKKSRILDRVKSLHAYEQKQQFFQFSIVFPLLRHHMQWETMQTGTIQRQNTLMCYTQHINKALQHKNNIIVQRQKMLDSKHDFLLCQNARRNLSKTLASNKEAHNCSIIKQLFDFINIEQLNKLEFCQYTKSGCSKNLSNISLLIDKLLSSNKNLIIFKKLKIGKDLSTLIEEKHALFTEMYKGAEGTKNIKNMCQAFGIPYSNKARAVEDLAKFSISNSF